MPIKKTFVDKDGNEIEYLVNTDNELFIQVGDLKDDNSYYSGWICLDKRDVSILIDELNSLLLEM